MIANPRFGTILSASGSATTWSENSRENRLTPFANDPVIDHGGEALFVRDDDTGRAWSPTPGPMPRDAGERAHPDSPRGRPDALLAIARGHSSPARGLRRRRGSGALRAADARQHVARACAHLSVFAYNDWVIGPPRELDTRHVITDYDAPHQAILASNPYNTTFSRPGRASRRAASGRSRRPATADRSSAATARWPGRRRSATTA